jgi:hypothetical protein
MNIKLMAYIATTLLLATNATQAQDDEKKKDKDGGNSIELSTDGLHFESKGSKDNAVSIDFLMIDLGINSIQDKTDYTTAAAKSFLQVPQVYQNENLFDLRTGKSWNINIWPVIARLRMVNADRQKIYLSTGLGLQVYNFRYNKQVTYNNDVVPIVYLDTVNNFSKNKLVVTYLSVPLMLTFKTKMADKAWLVYGAGLTGGYRISSYMKQVSTQLGKQKNHDEFNLSDFNACITAEIGIDEYFRLFASYQLTPLHENSLEQRPFTIGLRFGGV